MSSQNNGIPCFFSELKFIERGHLLVGFNKYAQAFLEELELHKTKNIDRVVSALTTFCTEKKVKYRLTIVDKAGSTLKTLYEVIG